MRFYEAFDLTPRLALDPEELQKRFYELSRRWHPDRFARAAVPEQQKALEMTAVLNDAFRALRDPVTRAEYFLQERSLPPEKNPPPELLEEVFELNMALEELRSGDDSARPQLQEARARFEKLRDEIDHGMQLMFARYDSNQDNSLLHAIRSSLDRRRYIANLIRDVDRELNKEAHVHVPN